MIRVKNKDGLLSIVRVGIFLLLLSPLIFWKELIFYYISTKVHFVLLVSELTMFFYCWLIWKSPEWRPKFDALTLVFFSFFIVSLLASIVGVDFFFSFWSDVTRSSGILMWIHLGAIFIIASSVFRTSQDWCRIFVLSTLIGLFVVALHLLSLAGINILINTQSGSTFGNSTFFGTYLLFQIFFSIYLFFQANTEFKRMYSIFTFLILLLGLVTIQAYAARISFLGGAVLFTALSFISFGNTRWKRGAGVSILVGLVFVFFTLTFLIFQPSSFIHKTVIDYSSEARFVIWDTAWQAIKERPLLGWGLENFEVVAVKYFNPCLGSTVCGAEIWFDSAHNILLDVMVDSGIIGLLAYLSLFATAIFQLWKSWFKWKQKSMTPIIFTTILFVYFVQNLTALDTVSSLVFFMLLLAFISSFNQEMTLNLDRTTDTKRQISTSTVIPVIATCLFPITFFFFVIQPIQGNRSTLRAIAPQPMAQHLLDYERALSISSMAIDRRRIFLAHSTSTFLWDTELDDLMVKQNAQMEVNLVTQALLETTSRSPDNLIAKIALGMLYQVQGRLFDDVFFQSAETVLKQAIGLSPRHQSPKWALASVYLEEGKINEAVTLTEEALELDSRVMKSHILNIIALQFLGDEQRLQKAVEETSRIFPNSDVFTKIEHILFVKNVEVSKQSLLYAFFL